MGTLTTQRISGWRVALRLGRVSNLPTVWSNAIAASALAGGGRPSTVVALAAAMSLVYVAGMFLNDAFDARHDARVRPERPIPSGEVGTQTVFAAGSALLAAGVLVAGLLDARAGLAALALAAAVILYDWHHKGVWWSPLVMGACRALVYLCAALSVAESRVDSVALPAAALLLYVAGLTYAARLETQQSTGAVFAMPLLLAPAALTLWQLNFDLPSAIAAGAFLLVVLYIVRQLFAGARAISDSIGLLIAAISINDALFSATTGAQYATLVCLACFPLTLILQRHVPGT
jgi:4-hydroxybenzoate polyprenyltransferase